ncbi:unnamed protein product [Chondrus crispus]|uniref:BRK domain-containing protein n=1 Tax=Chondrus crispus TaxID=2769 RepID=R7QCN2_CHOCR|nr:unnamed protein product [Chondrus crispus]CDF36272.1 unnamed protein product [Chondrus crispus]|eukprot:XP_005716091.1 unnamed protein product [Chondrus crispus]
MFKLKQSRSSSAATPPPQASQHPIISSRFNPIINVTAAPPAQSSNPDLASSLASLDSLPLASAEQPSSPTTPSFAHSAPVQIPRPSASRILGDSRPPIDPSLGASTALGSHIISFSPTAAIPQSMPNLTPSFPATLFGGVSAEDEHVTVWEPQTGKTVAGNAAPYRRNLATWLQGHPGWEEKADELKSSKRRSAARRSKSAADSFAALCCYPVASFLASDGARCLEALGDEDFCTEEAMMTWTADDFVRLQEALFRLGQECHAQQCNPAELDDNRWADVASQIGGAKLQGTIVSCAHHMLTRGIAKSKRELAGNTSMPGSFSSVSFGGVDYSGVDAPASVGSYENDGAGFEAFAPNSLPSFRGNLGASFLEKSFRAPREPRVTVWNPSNGRTISGNAAPYRRNLEAWMCQHPGWCPKEEGQLSSSRRNRSRKVRPSSVPTASEGEMEHEALEGLLFLARSPSADMSSGTAAAQLGKQMGRVRGGRNGAQAIDVNSDRKKLGNTSSISSSSAEYGSDNITDEEDEEDAEEDCRMEM